MDVSYNSSPAHAWPPEYDYNRHKDQPITKPKSFFATIRFANKGKESKNLMQFNSQEERDAFLNNFYLIECTIDLADSVKTIEYPIQSLNTIQE